MRNERSHWYLNVGQEYKNAAWNLVGKFSVSHNSWTEQVEKPAYYCMGFAIEQFLKGYITLLGKTPGNTHNLEALINLDKQILKFFSFSVQDHESIKMINQRYFESKTLGKYDLRYPSVAGVRISPHPDNLYDIVKRMEIKLREKLLAESRVGK